MSACGSHNCSENEEKKLEFLGAVLGRIWNVPYQQ
jgi:hypothetical protein